MTFCVLKSDEVRTHASTRMSGGYSQNSSLHYFSNCFVFLNRSILWMHVLSTEQDACRVWIISGGGWVRWHWETGVTVIQTFVGNDWPRLAVAWSQIGR